MGDVIAAELREGFRAFDFGIPFILQETDELRDHRPLDVEELPPFTTMSLPALAGLLGKGTPSSPKTCRAPRCSATTGWTVR